VITIGNADQVQGKVILPGANIAVAPAAESQLRSRGILSIPSFIANAGGVICAATEWRGGDAAQAFTAIEQKIHANTVELIERMEFDGRPPSDAAEQMALERIQIARRYRRF
jgi:glutamate dehydrogenase/leucine dehydrogenase